MRPEEIPEHQITRPFKPIRVFVSGGSYYDVLHEDFMFVSRSDVIIGLSRSPDEIPRQNVHLNPLHIARIEAIGAMPST